MFERFDDRARKIVTFANKAAQQYDDLFWLPRIMTVEWYFGKNPMDLRN